MPNKVLPDHLVLDFFHSATAALEEMDYASALQESSSGPNLALSDCRRGVLGKQKSVLSTIVRGYNQQHGSSISVDDAQGHLAGLNDTTDITCNVAITEAMTAMEEAARRAVCRLVLYAEMHWNEETPRELQSEGTLERSKLLDYMALCLMAIKLPFVQKHLADGSPLFSDQSLGSEHRSLKEDEPTPMKFPQARLERIQRYLSRAVGWHPDFTTRELRRLFFMQPIASQYANDSEVLNRIHQVILQMNAAVTTASLQASKIELSDIGQGGVTRVVSVQCSDVSLTSNDDVKSQAGIAPTKVTIDPHLTEDEQKRQIRMASEATRLQQELVTEILSMTEEQRNRQLDEARRASEDFLKRAMALPPGRERIEYLQSIDPQTSRLLAIHKLWPAIEASQGPTH